jgi:uncharacterized protein RhaS with RHS repeats
MRRIPMFDPTIGRWLSPDPEGFEAGDENLYRYVHNNPINATDPTGLQERLAPLPYIKDAVPPPERLREVGKVRVAVITDNTARDDNFDWVPAANTKRGVQTAEEVATFLEKNFKPGSVDVLVLSGHSDNRDFAKQEAIRAVAQSTGVDTGRQAYLKDGVAGVAAWTAEVERETEKRKIIAGAGMTSSIQKIDESMSRATADRIKKMLSPNAEIFIAACSGAFDTEAMKKLSEMLGGRKVTASPVSTYRQGYSDPAEGGKDPWITVQKAP